MERSLEATVFKEQRQTVSELFELGLVSQKGRLSEQARYAGLWPDNPRDSNAPASDSPEVLPEHLPLMPLARFD